MVARRVSVGCLCLSLVACGDGARSRPSPAVDAEVADATPAVDAGDAAPAPTGDQGPPAPPTAAAWPCYSPCSEALTLPDGSLRACDADGLMLGCLGALACVDGSCVTPGQAPPACASDAECPDFQACVDARCRSTCEQTADCEGDLVCHRKVCRVPCGATTDACPEDTVCALVDGVTGFCMPAPGLREAPAEPPPDAMTFEVSAAALKFGPTLTEGTFSVTNTGPRAATLRVTKREQVTFTDAGRVVSRARPLPWLRLALGDAAPEQADSVTAVLPSGGTQTVRVAGAATQAFERWEGELQITLGELASPDTTADLKRVSLEFSSRPDGRYVGTLHQFAQFNDRDLDAFRNASRNDRLRAAQATDNALLVRWAAFRSGTDSLDAFEAMLSAVNTGAWSRAPTRKACREVYPRSQACYLFSDGSPGDSGVQLLSDAVDLRVPGGHVEAPLALELAAAVDDPHTLEGWIDSAFALQYPGNPPARLTFGADPTTCEAGQAGACIVPVAALTATAAVGARFAPGADGCDSAGEGFERISTPWLPTDFVAGTRLDADGARFMDECRTVGFPLDASSAPARALNAAAAGSAPLPDGRVRLRELDLVDGVFVNQTKLILLTRERFEGVDGEPLQSYGVAVLERVGPPALPDATRPGGVPAPSAPPALGVSLACGEVLDGQTPEAAARALLEGLAFDVGQAFRFRTEFRTPTGQAVGFVPALCGPGGVDLNPYCYDPTAIEALAGRIDCLVDLWQAHRLDLTGPTRLELKAALTAQFASQDGFERLYVELLVMLADDDLVRAAASRFDIAGVRAALFEGPRFEPGGLELAGGLGNQMTLLYRALQRYDQALGRFQRHSAPLWRAMGSVDTSYITPEAVTTYFERLLRASTRRTEAVSEAANVYAGLLEPELARGVIERGFARASLEATTLTQFIRRATPARGAARDQLESTLETASVRYAIALGRLRESYARVTNERTIFGLPPDLVPFLPISGRQVNAGRTILDQAADSVALALRREQAALAQDREVEGGAAQFQAALVGVRNEFEDQLAAICGTLTGPPPERRILPAIAQYAGFDPLAEALGEPCGLMGNGEIVDALGRGDDARLGLDAAVADLEARLEAVEVERRRGIAECGGRDAIALFAYESAAGDGGALSLDDAVFRLRQDITQKKREMAEWDEGIEVAKEAVGVVSAAITNPLLGVATGAVAVATAGAFINRIVRNDRIEALEDEIATKTLQAQVKRTAASRDAALRECCLDQPVPAQGCARPGPLMVQSEARVDTLMLAIKTAELNVLRAELRVRIAYSEVLDLRRKVVRLEAQRAEAEQNLVYVEAARSDPNVRLTRNAAILDADKSFDDAVRDAYRATRVVEYFTSQSYPRFNELLLTRMVRGSEFGLENYVIDLDRYFRAFEERSGRPELRVAQISLRDDIWAVGRSDTSGGPTTLDAREAALRERLADPALLDAYGAIVVPFSTGRALASPLTRDHKIDHVEVELKGTFEDGAVGRLTLTQRGTGAVEGFDGETRRYRFDPLTTVINPFFNGKKSAVFAPEVYMDQRFRDRPLFNSAWALRIDAPRDGVRSDINPAAITDVVLYVYYTDFVQQ